MTARRWLLATLLLGFVGSATELTLLGHYEDGWQIVPLALIGLALILLAWHVLRPTRVSTIVFRTTMASFVVTGVLGVLLHMQGAAEFQLEIDPAMDRWSLLGKVLRAKAPPALAPGLMMQLGLIGLAFTYSKERRP